MFLSIDRPRQSNLLHTAMLVGVFILGPNAAIYAAEPRPATDELLGFSRYLPDDVDGYASLLQAGRVRRTIADSNLWKRIAAEPEVADLLARTEVAIESDQISPPVRTALELLAAMSESEVTLAVRPDVSRNLLTVGRVGLLSAAIFAPVPYAPDSPAAKILELTRSPMRKQWLAAVPTIRLPSFVVAARVRDGAKYEGFVRGMLDMGYQTWLAEIDRAGPGLPPTFKPALQVAYSQVKIGNTSQTRFHLRAGDILPPENIKRAMSRMPVGEAEKAAAVAMLADLTLNVHLGFVGEYLTLTVSSNDEFIDQIVERYEGRSQATLAASAAFAPIRAELSDKTAAILFTDGSESHHAVKEELLPTLDAVTDSDFLQLLGAPPHIMPMIQRMRLNLDAALDASPVKQHGVMTLDRGLQQFARMEMNREPSPAAPTPLTTPTFVPSGAIGYSAHRFLSLEGLSQQVRFLIEQQRQMNGGGGEFEVVRNAQLKAILMTIDSKLAPSLQGETALIAGGFTKFSMGQGMSPPIRDVPVPTLAVIVRSPMPDLALEGLRELYDEIVELSRPPHRAAQPVPLVFLEQDVDGLKAWTLTMSEPVVEGLDLHMVRLGDALIISSSFELTKQIRETQAGRAPTIAANAKHQSLQDRLPLTAEQVSFFDGEAFHRSLRSTADAIFGIVDKSREHLSETEQADIVAGKRNVDLALSVIGCIRSGASSIVAEGKVDVLREWIHLEDISP